MRSPEPGTGVVLLAAGQGKRFGGGKLIADFRGRPLWEWAAEAAENIDFGERLVIVGKDNPIGQRPGWTQIDNPAAERGMGTSIAAGVAALKKSHRAVIMLADMPLVSPSHLNQLVASEGVAFTRYSDGSPGCPAAFPSSAFPQLALLTGNEGARSLGFTDVTLVSPRHERELADIDTVCELQRIGSKS